MTPDLAPGRPGQTAADLRAGIRAAVQSTAEAAAAPLVPIDQTWRAIPPGCSLAEERARLHALTDGGRQALGVIVPIPSKAARRRRPARVLAMMPHAPRQE